MTTKHIALLLVGGMVSVGACGTAEKENQPGSDVTIALHPYFRDLRTVHATLGADTLTLLFDTGGGATLIVPNVAQRLGCRPYGRDVGYRMTGERVQFQRCDSLTLGLAGWPRRMSPVSVFDVNALLPTELPRLDGVLALDAFRGQVLSIDWSGSRLIVHSAGSGNAAIGRSGLTIRAATGESGRMLSAFVEVAGRRGPLWFLLDSGNLRGTLTDSLVVRDSLLIPRAGSMFDLRVGGGTMAVNFQQAGLVIDGTLGLDVLKRGVVTLDLRRLP